VLDDIDALLGHGIEIPVPQRDLNLRSWFGDAAKSGEATLAVHAAAQHDPKDS
jgi:hypothetical protein